ncbi:hypothetical protein B296_00037560 [Ensete ventricosum]|uniref:Integrase zinc-binding domain-containing protein n=1 Tax=Ensete ventricosum TaxID=4639 RepID=A0A426X2G9_ENSVE|nr:hypothetical protein B296_00037560 [Ensete ventricosum]
MKSHSKRRNKRRYCRFHREYDHDTEECRDLQYQIEDLIWRGHLRRYVRDQSSLPDSRPPRDSSPRPKGSVEKQIDVIFGGPASGGDSSSARKVYARSEVGKRPTHDEDLDITFKSRGKETEAVLPPEVVFPTLRVQTHGEEASNQQLRKNLDLLEEKRANAHLRTLAYRRAVTKLYNRRVHPRLIKMGDLVLRKAEVNDPTRSRGKLAPNWECPYRVVEVVREGTYTLATMEG